jgi:hypothetical protein
MKTRGRHLALGAKVNRMYYDLGIPKRAIVEYYARQGITRERIERILQVSRRGQYGIRLLDRWLD